MPPRCLKNPPMIDFLKVITFYLFSSNYSSPLQEYGFFSLSCKIFKKYIVFEYVRLYCFLLRCTFIGNESDNKIQLVCVANKYFVLEIKNCDGHSYIFTNFLCNEEKFFISYHIHSDFMLNLRFLLKSEICFSIFNFLRNA